MSPLVFLIVLFAAALHASWNAIVKRGSNTLLTTITVTAAAALIAAALLPFLPPPDRASWPFIAASTLLQIAYYLLVARIYRVADMGMTYPIMRGTAPLLVALASPALLDEALPATAWSGIAVICLGMLSIARREAPGPGLILALLNALVIASYTVIDGIGVRRSAAPAAYTLWIFLLTGLALTLWAVLRQRKPLARYATRNWPLALVGGIGTMASYGIALWAMTVAPIAIVAALRETSILFAIAIAALVLRETVSPTRIAAACIIATGVITLRLT